jgi:hypothetical protein
MSRKTVCALVFLLAMCTGAFAQETKTQDTTKQESKATTTKKKAVKKKKTGVKSPAATETSKDQGAGKNEAAGKDATSKDQAATKAASRDQGAAKGTGKEAVQGQGATKKVPKDVVILKGAPMGGVKFLHTAHSKERNIKCETCHHPSKTEKPSTAAQQACTDCHTKVAAAPMKTKLQAAFHNPTATAGICIDCHKAQNAKGKKAPTKCMECHKKENV